MAMVDLFGTGAGDFEMRAARTVFSRFGLVPAKKMTILATLVHLTALLSAVNITVLSIEVGNVLGIVDKCVSVLMSPNELVNKYLGTTSDMNSKKKLRQ